MKIITKCSDNIGYPDKDRCTGGKLALVETADWLPNGSSAGIAQSAMPAIRGSSEGQPKQLNWVGCGLHKQNSCIKYSTQDQHFAEMFNILLKCSLTLTIIIII
jgi:hypothetical protein